MKALRIANCEMRMENAPAERPETEREQAARCGCRVSHVTRLASHVSLLMAFCLMVPNAFAQEFKAGVASIVITPTEPTWAGGYGGRTRPVSETLQDLYAKALVLEDAAGMRVVIVTTDLLGFPRSISEPLCRRLEEKYQLRREQILLNSSHTHCGPVLRESLIDVYPMSQQDWDVVRRYSEWMQGRIVQVVGEALAHLQPARLSQAIGHCDFAVNRRENREKDVVPGYQAKGPVDHDLPVLRISDGAGGLRAVLFRYSCHCTTMDFYKWCGDYAGFAQAEIEKKHPGVTALFAQGCGGDANPLPRRQIELCEKYGRQLAAGVEAVLDGPMKPLQGRLGAAYQTIPLALADLPDRPTLEAQVSDEKTPRTQKTLARRMLALLDKGEPLPSRYPAYPVQAIRIGDLTLAALGGEVVVDYCLRLQKELGRERTWFLGYSNDVMAYIPSRRVLSEGGYEGYTSMAVYGLPGRWAPGVEESVVSAVHDVVRQVRGDSK